MAYTRDSSPLAHKAKENGPKVTTSPHMANRIPRRAQIHFTTRNALHRPPVALSTPLRPNGQRGPAFPSAPRPPKIFPEIFKSPGKIEKFCVIFLGTARVPAHLIHPLLRSPRRNPPRRRARLLPSQASAKTQFQFKSPPNSQIPPINPGLPLTSIPHTQIKSPIISLISNPLPSAAAATAEE